MYVSSRALAKNPVDYLEGTPYVPGLPYSSSAELQACLLIIMGGINETVRESHASFELKNDETIFKLLSIIEGYCTRKSSTVLLNKVFKDLFKGNEPLNEEINWDYWAAIKHHRNFSKFWDSLLPQDKEKVKTFVDSWRLSGDVGSTPDKSDYIESLFNE